MPGVAKSANAAEETAPEPAAAKAPTPTAAAAISPPAKEEEAANKVSAGQDDQKISLSLRAVLQCMPAFQLTGSVDQVKEEARIEFPFSLVERQLAQGRIAVPAQTFVAALPEEHRGLFKVDEQESPVLLPLHEVLKNLPASALKMREDQEAGDVGGAFETPFSIKAAEDAQRFVKAPGQPPVTEEKASTPAAPAESKAKEPRVPQKEKGTEPQPAIAEKTEPAPSVPEVSPKSESFKIPILKLPPLSPEKKAKPQPPPVELQEPNENGGTEANTNAKDIVSRASELEGVAACSVTFEDGLGLAGNLPDDVQAGGLCAMAPSVLQKMNRHTAETKLGPLVSMTLHCRESQMSFFMQGNVCLTILHKQGPLPPASYESLTKMATELSRTYSQPETVHVDH